MEYFKICIFFFFNRTAESYRKSFIAQSGGESLKAHKLFCSWDFGISNQRAANLKRHSIYLELRTILNELIDNEFQLSMWQRIGCLIISMVIWLFIALTLIVIAYSIVSDNILEVQYFLKFNLQISLQHSALFLLQEYEKKFSGYFFSPPLFIPTLLVVSMLLIHSLFEWLGTLEDYKSPRSQLHITLIRNYLLEITIITSLIVNWLSHTKDKVC